MVCEFQYEYKDTPEKIFIKLKRKLEIVHKVEEEALITLELNLFLIDM